MSENQTVANAGIYFAAYRLCSFGWNVMPTSRNARGVDLLIYDKEARVKKAIQVKTVSARHNIRLSNDDLMGDFWIIIAKVKTEPECFIMTPNEVRKRMRTGKTGQRWIQPSEYDKPQFREAWHRLGRGDDHA
jgi:hypothetical protein